MYYVMLCYGLRLNSNPIDWIFNPIHGHVWIQPINGQGGHIDPPAKSSIFGLAKNFKHQNSSTFNFQKLLFISLFNLIIIRVCYSRSKFTPQKMKSRCTVTYIVKISKFHLWNSTKNFLKMIQAPNLVKICILVLSSKSWNAMVCKNTNKKVILGFRPGGSYWPPWPWIG